MIKNARECPVCHRLTFFQTPTGRKCTNPDCPAHAEMFIPANGGKGGKGAQCPKCRSFSVFSGVCRRCGARSNY